jgi:cysteine sulfinate desulfinase/cysteine desulfurase-like protein
MANVIVSLGMETTTDEVDAFVDAYRRAVERLRGMSPAWEDYQAGRVKSALGGAC